MTATAQLPNVRPVSHEPRPLVRQLTPFVAKKSDAGEIYLEYYDHTPATARYPDGQKLPFSVIVGFPNDNTNAWLLGKRIMQLLHMYFELEKERDAWAAERDTLLEQVRVAEGVAAQFRDSASQKTKADVKRRQES